MAQSEASSSWRSGRKMSMYLPPLIDGGVEIPKTTRMVKAPVNEVKSKVARHNSTAYNVDQVMWVPEKHRHEIAVNKGAADSSFARPPLDYAMQFTSPRMIGHKHNRLSPRPGGSEERNADTSVVHQTTRNMMSELLKEVDSFEAKHGITYKEMRQAIKSNESTELPLLSRKALKDPLAQTVATGPNPIVGALSTVPLHKVRDTYVSFFGDDPTALKVGITFDQFSTLIGALVPQFNFSETYLTNMFHMLDSGRALPRRVSFSALFRPLINFAAPRDTEKTIAFFFKCMDEKQRAVISGQLLIPGGGVYIRSWAENRVIGDAIHYWRALATTVDKQSMIPNFGPVKDSQLTIDDVREIVYGSKALSIAFHGLECHLTEKPRFDTTNNLLQRVSLTGMPDGTPRRPVETLSFLKK